MIDRTGQTWIENSATFVVTGPPIETPASYVHHPICVLDDHFGTHSEGSKFCSEGEIPWEKLPYMVRIT